MLLKTELQDKVKYIHIVLQFCHHMLYSSPPKYMCTSFNKQVFPNSFPLVLLERLNLTNLILTFQLHKKDG